MYAITPELMRKIDAEQAKLQPNGERTLMYNAGLCAVSAIEEKAAGEKAVILCGTGNYAGDGYVVAEELRLQGWNVTVFNYLPKKKRTDAANHFMHKARAAGCKMLPLETGDKFEKAIAGCDVIVDAVFGTGFHGSLPEELEAPIRAASKSTALKVSIDCPSGVDPLHGTVGGTAFIADITVCMSYPMRGIYLLPARAYCGRIEVCDIGMDYRSIESEYAFTDTVCDKDAVRKVFIKRSAASHKGNYGRCVLICGSEAMPGAARLALSGALRMGPGLCELVAPKSVIACCAAAFPEAVYTEIPNSSEWSDEDVEKILARTRGVSAVLCGCGLGIGSGTEKLVSKLCSAEGIRLVLDADAINALSRIGFEKADCEMILTPHPGEFSRLTGYGTEEIAVSRYSLAKTFAAEKNTVLLLKGADTVTAAPDGRVCLNSTGNPGLAKGGSGDVLAGMCAGILAQGKTAFDAASCAAYLHGAAGDLLKEKYSEYGYLTGELAEAAAEVLGHALNEDR
ncbi:MAG: NAD(P)H-hydrate dehydratase [Clostridia bacterium]|nr:NAD(P)H-hydrate dehydratase [Clostridia bacterium]